jgi:hypothetical protein
MLRGVALRVDGDEQRLHAVGIAAQSVDRKPDRLEIGRTDVRAIGEAEIDQHQLPAKVALGADPAGVIGKFERATDRLPIPHQEVHEFGRRSCRRRVGRAGRRQHEPQADTDAAGGAIHQTPKERRLPVVVTRPCRPSARSPSLDEIQARCNASGISTSGRAP